MPKGTGGLKSLSSASRAYNRPAPGFAKALKNESTGVAFIYDGLSPKNKRVIDNFMSSPLAHAADKNGSLNALAMRRVMGLTNTPEGRAQINAATGAFADLPRGLRLQGTSIDVAGYGEMSVSTGFATPGGRRVGGMTRKFKRNGEVYHSLFRINDKHQGKGYGYDIFKHQINAYKKAGMKRVKVEAFSTSGNWNGGYTWSRFGFTMSNSALRNMKISQFDSFLRNRGVSEGVRARVRARTKTVGDISSTVLRVGGKRIKIGKEFMSGDYGSFNGTFSLAKTSKNLRAMRNYLKVSKKMGERVKDSGLQSGG